MNIIKFPGDFSWGTSASAYQTEGGNTHSDWHTYEIMEQKKPENKRRLKEPCGNACEHWLRYEEDFDLAKGMGIRMHRLSIEWSRIFPEKDRINKQALTHYRKILKALHKRKIKVMLCLHHFTIPSWLAKKGGFLNTRMIMRHFNEYIDVVVNAVGDLVDYWVTINEPNMVAICSFLTGIFPPFKKNLFSCIKVSQTLLKLHADTYQKIKKKYPGTPVGIAYAYSYMRPYDPDNPKDCTSALRNDRSFNLSFFESIRTGKIMLPFSLKKPYPGLRDSLDFIGINYYFSVYTKGKKIIFTKPGEPVTDMGWCIFPEGLYKVLTNLYNMCDLPFFITENGIATTDESFRISYMDAHIRQIHRAISEGVPVKGYMYWSLTDNFEWNHGYSKKFGLIDIDFNTQKRSIKEGGKWYTSVIRRNGIKEGTQS